MTDKRAFRSDLQAGEYDDLICEKCGKPVAFKDFSTWGLKPWQRLQAVFVCEHGHGTVIDLGRVMKGAK